MKYEGDSVVANISMMLKKAKMIQDELTTLQEKLANHIVYGNSGGGAVKVSANAELDIISIDIDQSLLNTNDKELIEELIVSAVNDAYQKARKVAQKAMETIAEEIPISDIL